MKNEVVSIVSVPAPAAPHGVAPHPDAGRRTGRKQNPPDTRSRRAVPAREMSRGIQAPPHPNRERVPSSRHQIRKRGHRRRFEQLHREPCPAADHPDHRIRNRRTRKDCLNENSHRNWNVPCRRPAQERFRGNPSGNRARKNGNSGSSGRVGGSGGTPRCG